MEYYGVTEQLKAENQLEYIEEAERVTPTPFAFSFSQEDIDNVLRLGSNTENSRMVMVSEFQKQKPIEVIAARLSKEYHGGAGFKTDHGEFSAWYAEDGIHLAKGRSARYEKSAQVVSWEAAAERIGQLMEQGRFASNVEVIEAESYERTRLAEALWYHYGDISDAARTQGYMPTLSEHRHGGFPDATARLSEELKDPAFRQTLADELSVISAAYAQDDSLMRFRIYNPQRVLNMLKQHIINYSRTRQVFQEYKASGYSKKFLKEHQQEIEDHRATKRVFNELGLKKLPTVKSLNEEYSQVLAAKKSVYAQLRTAEAERRELLIHRENLRPILAPEEKPRGKRKEQDER